MIGFVRIENLSTCSLHNRLERQVVGIESKRFVLGWRWIKLYPLHSKNTFKKSDLIEGFLVKENRV